MVFKALYILTGLLLAAMLSQFPEFQQQYRQRLGGTLDELNRQVEALDQRAAQTNMTRYNYVRHLMNSDDTPARLEGENLEYLLKRQFSVDQALKELDQTPEKLAFVTVLLYLDVETARSTAEVYKPAVPLTTAGAVYAGIGFVGGYILMAFLCLFVPRRLSTREAS